MVCHASILYIEPRCFAVETQNSNNRKVIFLYTHTTYLSKSNLLKNRVIEKHIYFTVIVNSDNCLHALSDFLLKYIFQLLYFPPPLPYSYRQNGEQEKGALDGTPFSCFRNIKEPINFRPCGHSPVHPPVCGQPEP